MNDHADLKTVILFLLGVGKLDGVGFGEDVFSPTGRRLPYWWRDSLREAFAALEAGRSGEAVKYERRSRDNGWPWGAWAEVSKSAYDLRTPDAYADETEYRALYAPAPQHPPPVGVTDDKPMDLEIHEREALNYLGSSLRDRNAKRAVDKALALCDFYAGRNQLTFAHRVLLNRELLPAAAPAVAKMWFQLLERIAEPAKCVASEHVDGNEHVVQAVQRMAEGGVEWYGPDSAGHYYIRRDEDWFHARPQEMVSPADFLSHQQPAPGVSEGGVQDLRESLRQIARQTEKLTDDGCEDCYTAACIANGALARSEAAAMACPECRSPGLLFECVACSTTNFPQPAPVSEHAYTKATDPPHTIGSVEDAHLLIPGETSSKLGDAASGEGLPEGVVDAFFDALKGAASHEEGDYELGMEEGWLASSSALYCALETAIRRLTTTGQGDVERDWNMARHWIDRYAAGVDDEPQLDLIAQALGLPDPFGQQQEGQG